MIIILEIMELSRFLFFAIYFTRYPKPLRIQFLVNRSSPLFFFWLVPFSPLWVLLLVGGRKSECKSSHDLVWVPLSHSLYLLFLSNFEIDILIIKKSRDSVLPWCLAGRLVGNPSQQVGESSRVALSCQPRAARLMEILFLGLRYD